MLASSMQPPKLSYCSAEAVVILDLDGKFSITRLAQVKWRQFTPILQLLGSSEAEPLPLGAACLRLQVAPSAAHGARLDAHQ